MLRCFIAIELPEEIKSSLAETENELKKTDADIRWARPENIHLTLKFLGDTAEESIDGLIEKVAEVCGSFDPFNIEVNGLGVFPQKGAPRVLWAGLDGGKTIISLREAIEEGAEQFGFKREKRAFSPHLTIGRFRSLRFKDTLLNEVRAKQEISIGSFEARSVILYKSELRPSGAIHTKINESLLKAS